MKAFILAGGFATRLWPLTEKRAKPLLPLAGKPIISHIVEKIPEDIPITVSTNAVFMEGFEQWKKDLNRDNLEILIEDTRSDDQKLGALGAVSQWIQSESIDEDVLLLTGDNYFGFEISDFIEAYSNGTPILAAFDIGDEIKARSFGTVILEKSKKPTTDNRQPTTDIISAFEEKPKEPSSTIVSTGCSILPESSLPVLVEYAKEHPDNVGGIFEEFLNPKTENRTRTRKPSPITIVPYLILTLIFVVVALGGKARVIASVTLIDKILVACKSTIFYIYKFLIPNDLTIIYPLQGDISLTDMRILPSVILAIILIMIAIKSLKKHPVITFGIGWYLVTLAPTYLNIGKANLVFFAVDRYAYLPMVGLLIVLVYIYKSIRPIARSTIIIILIVLSINQTNTWKTPDGVFRRTLSIYPESVGARVGLATILRHQNKFEEAFKVITEGVKYMDHSLLHMNAGFVYAATGQVTDAEERFRTAINMDPNNPEPYFSLGSLFEQTGRSDEAISFYEKAVELDGSYVIARAKLGNLYLKKNQTDKAREQFEKALEWNKFSVEANEGIRRIQDASI